MFHMLNSLRQTFLLRWPQYEKKVLIGLFLFALFARFSVNYWVLGIDFVSQGDSKGYESFALSLLTEHTFYASGKYAYRPPLYPLFLALIYGSFGFRNYLALKLIESIIGALTCILIYLIGKRIWGWPIGLAGAAIATLYPFFLFYTGAVLTENLFTFLLMAALYFLLQAEYYSPVPPWRGKPLYYLIMGGFLLGLGILTRGSIILLVPLLFFWAFMIYPTLRIALIGGGIVVGVSALTVLPWTTRNYLVLQKFIPVSTNGGITFWIGNNPIAAQDPDLKGRQVSSDMLPDAEKLNSLSELEKDRLAYQLGVDFLQNNPQLWGPLYTAKFKRFWSIVPDRGTREMVLSLASYGLIFPFFWIGLILAATYQRKPWLLWLVILATVLNTLIFYGSVRFRFPIEPLIILFAVLGFSHFLQIIDATYQRYWGTAKA